MSKREYWLLGGIGLLFAAIGIYLGVKKHENPPPAPDVAAILFTHTLPDLDGQQHPLRQWQGKILLVNFWATWCPPCVEEMPELSALQTELGSKNLQIIGIGVDSDSNIKQFAAKYKIDYPLYVAGVSGGDLSRQLGNQAGGLPYTLLIDAQGHVRKSFLGRLHMDTLRKELVAAGLQP